MLKGISIRLYPTMEQAIMMNKLLGCYRVVYNKCLDKKTKSYEENNMTETLYTLKEYLHHELLKSEEYFYLKEHNTKVLAQAIRDLLKAFENFFKHGKGYPKHKAKYDNNQSCRFESGAISKMNDYTTFRLTLTKQLKNIKFRCSKKYVSYLQKNKEHIKNATLRRLPSGEYYLSILVDGDFNRKPVKNTDKAVGIDLGVKTFVTGSDGIDYENLHFSKKEENKLKRLHRQLSRKEKKSSNRNKARKRLAKAYKKITDRKKYYLHSVTNKLIDDNQVICMEDLNVKGMLRNHCLAKAIQEANLGEFRRMLEYKVTWCGRKLVFVGRFFPSSKTCNHCKHVYKDLKLSERVWVCPHCGAVIDRDRNASLNILEEGLRILDSQ